MKENFWSDITNIDMLGGGGYSLETINIFEEFQGNRFDRLKCSSLDNRLIRGNCSSSGLWKLGLQGEADLRPRLRRKIVMKFLKERSLPKKKKEEKKIQAGFGAGLVLVQLLDSEVRGLSSANRDTAGSHWRNYLFALAVPALWPVSLPPVQELLTKKITAPPNTPPRC